jgi:tRNA(His) 5'-end guanylyltransferase
MKKDSLGNRMKQNYEDVYRFKLTRRTPVIVRLDGKAFHTLTRGCDKPFDDIFQFSMIETMRKLCEEIQGVKCAYTQSDEISLLLIDFDRLDTHAWFDYNLQKIVSVSASIASVGFSNAYCKTGIFDARAFNIPKDDVKNYFIWRQKDWERNSLQMLAQSHYSQKQLHKKNKADMHEMLYEKDVNWADLEPRCKNGTFMFRDKTIVDGKVIDSEWDTLDNLVLVNDDRPVIGSVFDYLVWYDNINELNHIDVFSIEKER